MLRRRSILNSQLNTDRRDKTLRRNPTARRQRNSLVDEYMLWAPMVSIRTTDRAGNFASSFNRDSARRQTARTPTSAPSASTLSTELITRTPATGRTTARKAEERASGEKHRSARIRAITSLLMTGAAWWTMHGIRPTRQSSVFRHCPLSVLVLPRSRRLWTRPRRHGKRMNHLLGPAVGAHSVCSLPPPDQSGLTFLHHCKRSTNWMLAARGP